MRLTIPPFLNRLGARDRELFLRLALHQESRVWWRRCWLVVTQFGGATFSLGVTLASWIVGDAWRHAAERALVVLVVSHLIVQALKRSIGRPRPSRAVACATLIAEPDRFSFPSGHAAAAMSVAIGYATAFPQATPLLASGAVVVGFSRVLLGVHYPGDVLAGQLIALATSAAVVTW